MLASTSIRSSEDAPLVARLLGVPGRHPRALAWIACALAALPAARLGWEATQGLLGPNLPDRLLRELGRWALILLVVVLCATPLRHALTSAARRYGIRYGRRPADWNWMLGLRRHVGIASVLYALAHLGGYLWLDIGFALSELATDLRSKPFIVAGLGALALLLPLALTSTDGWMRRLKRGWKRLHRLIYPAATLAVLHFVLLSKPGVHDAYGYALVLAMLLGYRAAIPRLRAREGADPLVAEILEEPSPAPAEERRKSGTGQT
jgi:sulfoxide reductase heme-binding subunit YedZ